MLRRPTIQRVFDRHSVISERPGPTCNETGTATCAALRTTIAAREKAARSPFLLQFIVYLLNDRYDYNYFSLKR